MPGTTANAERVTNDAVKEISAIDVQGPTRPEFLRLRAATEAAQGHMDAAEKDFKEALQIEPRNPILLLNYANLLWKTDRKEEARKTYSEALAIDPSNASALGSLGFVSREMGDNEAARRYFLELEEEASRRLCPLLGARRFVQLDSPIQASSRKLSASLFESAEQSTDCFRRNECGARSPQF